MENRTKKEFLRFRLKMKIEENCNWIELINRLKFGKLF